MIFLIRQSFLPAKCHTACNYPSECKAINTLLEKQDYYNQKQTILLSFNMEKMDFLSQCLPNLVFDRETYMRITCKSRARKRGWGQEVHILHVNI